LFQCPTDQIDEFHDAQVINSYPTREVGAAVGLRYRLTIAVDPIHHPNSLNRWFLHMLEHDLIDTDQTLDRSGQVRFLPQFAVHPVLR